MKDPKTGKQSYLWSDYQEWRALRQWYETIERFSVYSKFNANQDGTTDLKGTNGRPRLNFLTRKLVSLLRKMGVKVVIL